jgi:hypothetical protein
MRIISLFLTTLFLIFSQSFAQEDITAEGVGLGANHDEALLAAKRDAIEKGIGMVLISQTEVENFMLKKDQVITKTIGAVKTYQIISEATEADGIIKIKIRATLSKSSMKEDLAAFQVLIESMDKPKVMVIINESNIENDDPGNQAAENAIITFLKDPYGFDLVDPQVVASIKNSKQKMATLAGNAAEAAAIGTQFGAEVLITGTAISKKADAMSANLGGMVSVQADITLKAINCATGRIIGSSSEHAAKVHISPQTAGTQAIAKAAEKGAGKLLDAIIKDWQGQANNGLPLNVSVSAVTTFGKKNAIVQTLKGMSGVNAIHERSWDAQSGLFVIDIQYLGNPSGFCTKVDGFKMKTGGGSIAVTGVNGQNISLAIQAM